MQTRSKKIASWRVQHAVHSKLWSAESTAARTPWALRVRGTRPDDEADKLFHQTASWTLSLGVLDTLFWTVFDWRVKPRGVKLTPTFLPREQLSLNGGNGARRRA
jgi:hypothetical protein